MEDMNKILQKVKAGEALSRDEEIKYLMNTQGCSLEQATIIIDKQYEDVIES
jgi:hypothetical protein